MAVYLSFRDIALISIDSDLCVLSGKSTDTMYTG